MADEGEDAQRGSAIRVGDTDRRAVDELLQRAHGEGRLTLTEYEERAGNVWAARTQADLDAVTSDLPVTATNFPAAATTGREPVAVDREAGAAPWARRAGGLLAALVVTGAVVWGAGQVITADDGATVFGGRTIDVAPGDDRVELGLLFGRADVVVPDGARVVQSGTVIFGSVECPACSGTGPDQITVDVSGAFGSVDILTQGQAAAAAAEDAAEEAVENAEDAADDAEDADR